MYAAMLCWLRQEDRTCTATAVELGASVGRSAAAARVAIGHLENAGLIVRDVRLFDTPGLHRWRIPEQPGQWGLIPITVVASERLSSMAKLVYVALASFRSPHREDVAPTSQTVAEILGCERRTVTNALRSLAEIGAIEVISRGKRTATMKVLTAPIGSHATSDPFPTDVHSVPYRTQSTPDHVQNTRTPSAAVAAGVESPVTSIAEQPALSAELEPEVRPSAGQLVAAWCRGFAETHEGRQPISSVVKRVAGICRNASKDTRAVEEWRILWQAALAAGRDGHRDILDYADRVPRQSQYRPASKPSSRVILDLLGRGGEPEQPSARYDLTRPPTREID
jgi:predicted transcriptional regulator